MDVETLVFHPTKVTAVICMACQYRTGKTIWLFTDEEIQEHADLHALMR